MSENVNYKNVIRDYMSEGGFNVHDDLKDLSVPELREICDNERNPFAICTINVTGDMNIGSIIRTACLFGAEKVIVAGRKKFDRRGLVGSNNYIDIEFVPCLEGLDVSKDAIMEAIGDYTPVPVELGGSTIGAFNWSSFLIVRNGFNEVIKYRKPCLILGNENMGVPNDIVEAAIERNGFTVSIPQKGVIRSHNVSVAAGIVMSNLCLNMGWM